MRFGKQTRIRIILAAFCTLGLTSIADADALRFQKVAVKTTSESTCLRFARDVFTKASRSSSADEMYLVNSNSRRDCVKEPHTEVL